MQLIVLGMHRSGTSVLARLLNLMGAYFGPEGIGTGANKENPKGFWERRDVRALNDFVLHSAGCDWNRVSTFDVDKLPEKVVSTFRGEAAKLLLEMDGHRPWFIKEPRLCMLLPLWRPLLEAPVCIHVIRHPLEVAASLQTRNAMPIEAGLGLWEFHVRAATRAAADLPLAWTRHDLLMADTAGEVARLLEVLRSYGVHGLRMPAAAEMESFVDQDLHHEHASRSDLRAHGGSPQVAVYRQLAAFPPASAVEPEPTEASRRALAAYEATLPPVVAPASGLSTMPGDKALQGAQERIAKLKSDIVERDERIARFKADAAVRDERIVKLKADAVAQEERARALAAEASVLKDRFEGTQARLDLALVRESILERQLGDRISDVRRLAEIVAKLGRPT